MARDGSRQVGGHFGDAGPKPTQRRGAARRRPVGRTQSPGNARSGHAGSTRGVSSRTAHVTRATRPKATGRRAGARTATSRKRGISKLAVLLAIVVVALVVVGSVTLVRHLTAPTEQPAQVASGKTVTVSIAEGSSAEAFATKLKDAGIISTKEDFYKEVARQKAESKLKAGTYSFVTGADISEVVRQLQAGPNTSESRLVVAEGLTVEKTAAVVEQSLGISASDFLAQAKASNYKDDYDFLANAANDSLEGYLCPKTYDFTGKQVTADSVIRAMLDQYKVEVASLDFASGEAAIKSKYGVALNDYQVVTLASIIEREAVTEKDRPLVSSVFYNRLKADMALQSDATMGYVTGGEVTADDLKTESPYNSYLNKGLPPTPICTPSVESLKAALSPSDTDYYYFLIIENGSYSNHTFSKTYEEHEAAIKKAQADQS